MARVIKISEPAVIDTQWTALNVEFHIEAVSQKPLEQWYNETANQYIPDFTVTPLVLTPVLTIQDPDGYLTSTPTPSVTWKYNGVTKSSTSSSDPIYRSGNNLVIAQNTRQNSPVTVSCVAKFTDTRLNQEYEVEARVTLSTMRRADDIYTLDVDASPIKHVNPLDNTSKQFTYKAVCKLGDEDVSANVKFFWYYREVSGSTVSWVLFGQEDENLHPAYVSGQNTDTLIVDADYAEDMTVRVMVATDNTLTAPDLTIFADRRFLWSWPEISCKVFSKKGRSYRAGMKEMSFSLITMYNADKTVDDDKFAEYLRHLWRYRKKSMGATLSSSATSWTSAGWGPTVVLDESIVRNTLRTLTDVSGSLYLMGALGVVSDDAEDYVVTDEDTTTIVVGRTYYDE